MGFYLKGVSFGLGSMADFYVMLFAGTFLVYLRLKHA